MSRSRLPAPIRSPLLAVVAALLLAGCAVGPDYARPQVEVPAAYKEGNGWKVAEPRSVDGRSAWWESYGDETLNALVTSANAANQNIRQAEAQYRQAEAITDAARAGYFPNVGAGLSVSRGVSTATGRIGNSFGASLSASWEPDLWGGVRRAVESGEAGAAASADDLAAARLSIQTTVAEDYLQLRYIDVQRELYANTTAAYARALKLTQAQYAAGVVLRSDVALAQTQLKTAQAQAVDLDAQRSQLEHAIAILTGRPPANFTLPAVSPANQFQARMPSIPGSLPSQLLESRPDIAAAERRAALANANIGVAQAAFYPSLTLGASGGGAAGTFASLFDTPGRVWSLGATLAQSLFDGGLRRARTAQAVAAYDVAVAQYKEIVLNGFQQIEDDLAILRVLDRETALQDEAVTAARLAEQLALAQYRGGTASYLSVVTAQTLALSNQRTAVQLRSRQLTTSVALIAATGAGWSPATSKGGTAATEGSASSPPISTASTSPGS
ncbi:MAG: efflux transporter outer membrane subunit [Pseudomonadota bacterium]|nr:efflux transporter outer membrane subunit [Pseudomonadota bacterium]